MFNSKMACTGCHQMSSNEFEKMPYQEPGDEYYFLKNNSLKYHRPARIHDNGFARADDFSSTRCSVVLNRYLDLSTYLVCCHRYWDFWFFKVSDNYWS